MHSQFTPYVEPSTHMILYVVLVLYKFTTSSIMVFVKHTRTFCFLTRGTPHMASKLAADILNAGKLCFLTLFFTILYVKSSNAQLAPALFLFGDSLVDVGNNNYLPFSLVKADFPHNGLDFPTKKATGRFSNGKNAADFIAEKLGLPTSPPYLSLKNIRSTNFSTGVSFASGGAGIFNGTDELYHQSLTMSKQIEYFATVQATVVQQLGQPKASELLSKSIFGIVIGSNDILGYFGSSPSDQKKKGSPQDYVASMVTTIKPQLKMIYDLGARKFAVLGVAAVGCSPAQRDINKTQECNGAANFWATKYNQGLQSVLQEFKSELTGFQYSYFNTYDVLLNLVQQPATYGFKEVKAACCGLGDLNAKVACLPVSSFCSNRSDHVFWDFYHPTEAVDRIVTYIAFNGPKQYAYPVNIHDLATL